MIKPAFLRHLALWLAFWIALFFGITLLVDPYGVSPLKVSWSRFNQYKPKRHDIDRQIKPYEVWKGAPRTVFLGTSRIHQSFDPAVLDATHFAPAYNAAIPASSLHMNVAHLRQYARLDPKLRTVVVELFLYNFAVQANQSEPPQESAADQLRSTAVLFVSADALLDSVRTVSYNLTRNAPTMQIAPRGFQSGPPHDPTGPFSSYAAGIWKYHLARGGGINFYEPAFEAVTQLTELAREHGLELIFVLTPNHAYDDWYLETNGSWGAVAKWLTRVSAGATVYSFSQPNDWVYEPVGKGMRYWYDPYHFSLEMGAAMERSLAGLPVPGAPANFMQRMTPETVAAHIAARRRAIRAWAKAHPEFVASLAAERRKIGAK